MNETNVIKCFSSKHCGAKLTILRHNFRRAVKSENNWFQLCFTSQLNQLSWVVFEEIVSKKLFLTLAR